MPKQRPSSRRRQPKGGSSHGYPRQARLSEVLREIIGDELTRIDDERLEFVTVTSVDVDAEMNRAIVYYDSLAGVEGDEQIQEVLGEYRARMQSSINRQMHARKTPILSFKPDEVIRAAERIEQVLRENKERLARLDDGDYSPDEDDQ